MRCCPARSTPASGSEVGFLLISGVFFNGFIAEGIAARNFIFKF